MWVKQLLLGVTLSLLIGMFAMPVSADEQGKELFMQAGQADLFMQGDLFMDQDEEKTSEEKTREASPADKEVRAAPITIWDVALTCINQKMDVALQVMKSNRMAHMIAEQMYFGLTKLHAPKMLAVELTFSPARQLALMIVEQMYFGIVVVNSPSRQLAFIHSPNHSELAVELTFSPARQLAFIHSPRPELAMLVGP